MTPLNNYKSEQTSWTDMLHLQLSCQQPMHNIDIPAWMRLIVKNGNCDRDPLRTRDLADGMQEPLCTAEPALVTKFLASAKLRHTRTTLWSLQARAGAVWRMQSSKCNVHVQHALAMANNAVAAGQSRCSRPECSR
jgi:hypothetical protein